MVTDLEEFQAAVEQASASQDGTALAAALERWSGDLLPEDAFEPWAQRHAHRIGEWRTTLVMKLVEDDLVERDPQTAVALLAPVVAANPLHEPVHRAMMRALAGAGRRAEALVLFERLRTVLQQELAAEPGAGNPSAVPGTFGRAAARTPGRPISTTRRARRTCRRGSLR